MRLDPPAQEAPAATVIDIEQRIHGVDNLAYHFAPRVKDRLAEHLGGTKE